MSSKNSETPLKDRIDWITVIVPFLAILALCVFLMVKLMNRLMRKKEEAAAPAPAPEPAPTKEELLLTEIRDLLREQKK